MSKIFKGPKFKAPDPVAAPAPTVDVAATTADVSSGASTDSNTTLRRKYRPSSKALGASGTGLGL